MKPYVTLIGLSLPFATGLALMGIGACLFYSADSQATAGAANAMMRQSTIFFFSSSGLCLASSLGISLWLCCQKRPEPVRYSELRASKRRVPGR
jgi:hypothetical protein